MPNVACNIASPISSAGFGCHKDVTHRELIVIQETWYLFSSMPIIEFPLKWTRTPWACCEPRF